MRAHGHRPAGPHGDLPERDVAQLLHHGLGEVGFADAHAAAGDDGVGARGRVAEGLLQQRRLVAHHAQVDHLAAQAREQAVHRVAVAVVDRAFARRLAQAQDLVAGGEVGHAQAPEHRRPAAMPRLATRPQAAGPRRSPARSAGRPSIRSSPLQRRLSPGCSRPGRDARCGRRRRPGELLRHHRVQAGRHDRAGHDLHALAGAHLAVPGLARQRGAHHSQLQRPPAAELRAVEGEAVHGGVVVRRHADRRHEVVAPARGRARRGRRRVSVSRHRRRPAAPGTRRRASALSACGS